MFLSNLRLQRSVILTRFNLRPFSYTFPKLNDELHEINFKMTPYQVLNVADSENFDIATAKKNYYKLCKAYHPDTSTDKDDAGEKFLMVKEAYSILKDPLKKRGYDSYGDGWKYETAELKQYKKKQNGSSYSSMYGNESAARDRNMDEDTFWEYMNAATFQERARFNNRSYGNTQTYTSDHYEYNPLTMLPGDKMSKFELIMWLLLVGYSLYVFAFVGTYNFLFTEDLEAFTRDTDVQALLRTDLMNAYSNYDDRYADAWSRIRRFLFHRSYENYRHAVSVDDITTLKLEKFDDMEDVSDPSVALKKKIRDEIEHSQMLLDELKHEEIEKHEVNKYVNGGEEDD